jgi:tetratricopeptide (TPR) repeat protein
VPHFYRSQDEFIAAAHAAVADGAPKRPAGVLVCEVDPGDLAKARPGPDSTLGAVAEIARHTLRGDDHVACIGDHLVMVLANASAEDGRAVGERICAAVRVHEFGDALSPLTVSIGSASAPEHGQSFESVMDAATAALARITAEGRDGAGAAPLPHHEALHRPLAIDRFAGRVQELGSLTRWLDEACGGNPRVVSVYGETGTGTATLLRQLESEVWLRGGMFAMASSPNIAIPQPYGVWCALLRATHRFPGAPDREWSELQHLEPMLGNPKDAPSPTGSQYRLLVELTEYVRALAATRPLVIALDEMQWADSTSWDALEHLIGQLDNDRILICLAQRPDTSYEIAPHREMLNRHEIFRELTISRLTRDEVKQWLEAAFHRQQVGREFLAFVYRHTEGNPLFIAQTLRALMEDGAIWHNGGRWEWTPVSELRLPADRAELIAQRIGKFSSSTQAVLGTAAILGREFDIGLLVGAGAGSEPAVRLAISDAIVSGLLRPTDERRSGGFAFAHDEIAEVLVESIPRDRARQLHLRVAQALEKARPERAGEIALHFDAAVEFPNAYKWSQVAAKAADRVYAHGAAASYLQMAARNATSPAELAEIRVALAHVAETGGRFDEVEELCDLAIEWFDGQADERRALTIRRMRERARMEQGQPARRTLDALVALDADAKRLGFDRERVAILTMASQTHSRLGEPRLAERLAAEGVEMAELVGDSLVLGDALNRLGNILLYEAPARARVVYERALSLYEGIGDVRGQSRTYGNIGVVEQVEAHLDQASQAYGRALAVARAAGIPDIWGVAALNLGVLSQKCGEYDRARELFGEALGLFAAVKHSEYQLVALYNLAHVERELRLWESAAELYEATTPLAQRIGQSDIEIGAVAGEGLCLLELGRLEPARAALAEVRQRMESRPDWFQGREMAEALAIRVDALDGRAEEALSRFELAISLAEEVDLYNAAWLTTACAEALAKFDRERVTASIGRYSARVKELGYPEMTKRYDALADG